MEPARRLEPRPAVKGGGGGPTGGSSDPPPIAPTVDEIRAMIRSLRGRNRLRNVAMIRVCFDCAMRVSELVGLRYQDVNLGTGEVQWYRPKNGDWHTYWLTPPTVAAVQAYLLERRRRERLAGPFDGNAPLFVRLGRQTALTTQAFREVCAQASKDAGLPAYARRVRDPETGKYRPARPGETAQRCAIGRCHGLRHAKALDLLSQENSTVADVQRLLGHKSLETTQAYLRAGDSRPRELLDCADWL